jgi:G3E family GTPase
MKKSVNGDDVYCCSGVPMKRHRRVSRRLTSCAILTGLVPFVLCLQTCFGLAANPVRTNARRQEPIPITVLAGFLGSGKTTLLSNLLQNNEGLRIAVVVNDVASVNIDSKLVSSMNTAAGMVELQNGCACCSKSEELLASVADLVTLSDLRGDEGGGGEFHHIVVEMSGVADPVAVRSKFQEAALYDMPLLDRVQLDTMVTVVDCSMFLEHLRSAKAATPDEAPELYFANGQQKPEEPDVMVPSGLWNTLSSGVTSPPPPPDQESGVADLIVSQTETADVILLNKIDLASDQEIQDIEEMVKALNPRATVIPTEYANVPLRSILGVANGRGVVQAGIIDDHRDAVHAVQCHDPDCTHVSHSHHVHEHANSQSNSHDSDCSDPDCNSDPSHSHSHDHACHDLSCTDPSHHMAHGGNTRHAGIGSFVYTARRPFHPGRLTSFLRHLPVRRGLPPPAESTAEGGGVAVVSPPVSDAARELLRRVVRSKGFVWCADSHAAAMYWSQAGSSLELNCLGSWWATLPREQWPPEAVQAILQDFDNKDHDEQDTGFRSVGDRRQEVVFIGPALGESANQHEIHSTLDKCLLDDSEWSRYAENRFDEVALARLFPRRIESKMVSY